MKCRPMLFTGSMVRALLRPVDPKWQTRRIMKIPDHACVSADDIAADLDYYIGCGHCPYGKPGDRLWVREKWGYLGCSTGGLPVRHSHSVLYHADQVRRDVFFPSYAALNAASVPRQKIVHPPGFEELPEDEQRAIHGELLDKWWKVKRRIPSIHMPRWASRITLEITEIRVQRLQEISEEDAKAEGLIAGGREVGHAPHLYEGDSDWKDTDGCNQGDDMFMWCDGYRTLWESINGAGSWAANPWVWAINFRVIEKGGVG